MSILDDAEGIVLYQYVASLSTDKQLQIRSMIDRMLDIINEDPSSGRVALGILALEVTGLSITTVLRPKNVKH